MPARQSFEDAPPPALLCLTKDPNDDNAFTGKVTLADLIVFHNICVALLEQPITFEIKKKLFPVSTYLGDILSQLM